MEEIGISKFRANCFAVLERVRKTREPIRITKYGKPFADIIPAGAEPRKKSWLGSMAGTAKIVGDIISPVWDEKDWEALQ